MISPEKLRQIEAELSRAEQARKQGNEGLSRVCARRAAGAAIEAYWIEQSSPPPVRSSTDLIEFMRTRETTPEEIRTICEHLLMRVDTEYRLPGSIDLLAETHWLVERLAGQSTTG